MQHAATTMHAQVESTGTKGAPMHRCAKDDKKEKGKYVRWKRKLAVKKGDDSEWISVVGS